MIAADAAAEGGARQIVGRPGRLPWRKEGAAFGAELRPGRIIGEAGHAQEQPDALDDGRLIGGRYAKERHRYSRAAPLRPPMRAAISATSGSFLTGPIAASVGALSSMLAASSAMSSTPTASTFATISSSVSGRPC